MLEHPAANIPPTSPDSSADSGDDAIGRLLGGRYELQALLGSGASAHVYLAGDRSLGRQVAVKCLRPGLNGDARFRRRFRAEAQAAAQLSHPNLLAVYDWGEDPDAYLVTELLMGGSLQEVLTHSGRLSPSQGLLIALQAAQGLQYAHEFGIVHRDIKPANLLFGEEGRLRVADFGIARAVAEAAWTEPEGVLVGTARYAAPEQALGDSIGDKTDVYSLALTVIEAVTGRVPLLRENALGTMVLRQDRDVVEIGELGALGPALFPAGRADPEARPSANELIENLTEAARHLPRPERLPLVSPVDLRRSSYPSPGRGTGGPSAGPTPNATGVDDTVTDGAALAAAGLIDLAKPSRRPRQTAEPVHGGRGADAPAPSTGAGERTAPVAAIDLNLGNVAAPRPRGDKRPTTSDGSAPVDAPAVDASAGGAADDAAQVGRAVPAAHDGTAPAASTKEPDLDRTPVPDLDAIADAVDGDATGSESPIAPPSFLDTALDESSDAAPFGSAPVPGAAEPAPIDAPSTEPGAKTGTTPPVEPDTGHDVDVHGYRLGDDADEHADDQLTAGPDPTLGVFLEETEPRSIAVGTEYEVQPIADEHVEEHEAEAAAEVEEPPPSRGAYADLDYGADSRSRRRNGSPRRDTGTSPRSVGGFLGRAAYHEAPDHEAPFHTPVDGDRSEDLVLAPDPTVGEAAEEIPDETPAIDATQPRPAPHGEGHGHGVNGSAVDGLATPLLEGVSGFDAERRSRLGRDSVEVTPLTVEDVRRQTGEHARASAETDLDDLAMQTLDRPEPSVSYRTGETAPVSARDLSFLDPSAPQSTNGSPAEPVGALAPEPVAATHNQHVSAAPETVRDIDLPLDQMLAPPLGSDAAAAAAAQQRSVRQSMMAAGSAATSGSPTLGAPVPGAPEAMATGPDASPRASAERRPFTPDGAITRYDLSPPSGDGNAIDVRDEARGRFGDTGRHGAVDPDAGPTDHRGGGDGDRSDDETPLGDGFDDLTIGELVVVDPDDIDGPAQGPASLSAPIDLSEADEYLHDDAATAEGRDGHFDTAYDDDDGGAYGAVGDYDGYDEAPYVDDRAYDEPPYVDDRTYDDGTRGYHDYADPPSPLPTDVRADAEVDPNLAADYQRSFRHDPYGLDDPGLPVSGPLADDEATVPGPSAGVDARTRRDEAFHTAFVEDPAETGSHPQQSDLVRRFAGPVLAAVIALLVVATAIALLVTSGVLGSGESTETVEPTAAQVGNYLGLTVPEARVEAEANGWEITVTERREDGTEPGVITRQLPAAGETLAEGRTLVVEVSLGPELRTVPRVVGLTVDEAAAVLQRSGLQMGVVSERNDDQVEAGRVLTARVEGADAADQVESGTAVDLVVSSGPSAVAMPSFVGLTLEAALTQAADLGLVVTEAEASSETYSEGFIVDTTPPTSTPVTAGDQLTLVVSTGAPFIEVPSVVGLTPAEAADVLAGAGFNVTDTDGPPNQPVVGTDPAAGVAHRKGDDVVIRTQTG